MSQFNVTFESTQTFDVDMLDDSTMFPVEMTEVIMVESGDYNKLSNKPSINEVVLVGNKSFEDLGDHTMGNLEIKAIFDRVFYGGNNG